MNLLFSLDPLRRLIATSMLMAATVSSAQPLPDAFPQRTVRLVVPFTAGGTTDIIARVIADKLRRRLGQPVVVDNRPGASTMIATEQVAKAPADGYTLLLGSSTTFSMLPALRAGLPIAAESAWAPIGIIAQAPVMLSTRADSGIKSFADLLARAKAHPGAITYGTTGPGTAPYIVGAMIAADLQADITPVSYRGSTQILADVVGGRVDLSLDPFAAPRATPQAVVDRLEKELQAVLVDPSVEAAFQRQSIRVMRGNAEDFRQRVQGDITRYRRLAQEGRIKVE
ncbi:hypothetical protein OR16_36995 [Cupriavidus basilensis OR16]|uniref:Extra-cytoplasmic solute receptor n=1 Tax=Cupriavidus basilensis OR16 TaxID=1127483 RepID=H1SG88_9BURK|nr:tripartite tricarboxylate transporter substrate binding protein [Cupriavidus basilensis]EHP38426.1 hypothetical protein OR16_36995 [Cupriavidus basilensis OR16]